MCHVDGNDYIEMEENVHDEQHIKIPTLDNASLAEIAQRLDARTLARFEVVSKRVREICTGNQSWRYANVFDRV